MSKTYVYEGCSEGDCNDAKNSDCKTCEGKRRFRKWVLCDDCHYWYHIKCLNVDPNDIDTSEGSKFSCPECKNNAPSGPAEGILSDVTFRSQTEPLDSQATELYNHNDEYDVWGKDQDTLGNNDLSTQSSQTEIAPAPEDETDGDTDEEGHATIVKILDFKILGNGRRVFKVQFKKGEEIAELPEKNLNGCIDLLNEFCDLKKIRRTKMEYSEENCGSSNSKFKVKENWASIQDIIEAANIYGRKDGLKFEN